MNCKQGDLAVVVRSLAGNEGKFVTCLRLATSEEVLAKKYYLWRNKAVWVLDTPLKSTWGDYDALVPDERLRPIRDNNGEDETLQWAPVPTKETA